MKQLFLAAAWRIDEWAGWMIDPTAGTIRYLICVTIFAVAAANPAVRAWAMRSVAILRANRVVAALTPILAAGCVAVAWAYAATPAFIDHVEPQIAAVSWLFASGQPIWHASGAPVFYALPYGPLTYEIGYAMLALFGPSLTAAKLAGPAAATATLAILWNVIRRSGLGRVAALVVFATLVVMLFRFSQSAYWNRPDPFIVLLVAAALWLRGRYPHTVRWAMLGAIASALAMLKIHAPAYVLPIIAAELVAARPRGRAVAAMALGAAGVVTLAFQPANADPQGFLFWVGVAMDHGGNAELLLLNIAYVAVWLVPIAWLARRRWPALAAAERVMTVTLAAVAVLVLYPASKHGAGPWHFVPLVPVALVLALDLMRRGGPASAWTDRSQGLAAYGLVVGALTLPAMAVAQTIVLRSIVADDDIVAARAELSAALDRHRGETVAVGYAGSRLYPVSFLRPVAVYRGNPYVYDGAAFMDLQYAKSGLRPPALELLAECRIDVWLIPAGERPFSMPSYYDGKPAFPPAVVDAFRTAYRRVAEGRHFDTWTCARR